MKEVKVDVVFVDSSTIPIHRHGSGALKKTENKQFGRGRKGLGTTLHLAIGIDGVLNSCLSPAQNQDCKVIENLWQIWNWNNIKAVVADKGYDSSSIRNVIKSYTVEPVIPRKGVFSIPKPKSFDVLSYTKHNQKYRLNLGVKPHFY